MTEQQQNAVYGAYMGICVLQTMCRKVGLNLAVQRCDALLLELSTAFPTVYEQILLSPLRDAAATDGAKP